MDDPLDQVEDSAGLDLADIQGEEAWDRQDSCSEMADTGQEGLHSLLEDSRVLGGHCHSQGQGLHSQQGELHLVEDGLQGGRRVLQGEPIKDEL